MIWAAVHNDPGCSATVGEDRSAPVGPDLQALILVRGANQFLQRAGIDSPCSLQARCEKNGFHEPPEAPCAECQFFVFFPGNRRVAASNSAAYLGSNSGTKPARFQ